MEQTNTHNITQTQTTNELNIYDYQIKQKQQQKKRHKCKKTKDPCVRSTYNRFDGCHIIRIYKQGTYTQIGEIHFYPASQAVKVMQGDLLK